MLLDSVWGAFYGLLRLRKGGTVENPGMLTFWPFHLDLRAGWLQRGSETIRLRPKTWAVLVHLAERPGVLVTRDELLDAVWPDVAVTPDTLTKSIEELRVALGDDFRAPRYIETVHRRGFRFIATLGAPDEPSEEPEARSAVSPLVVGRAAELESLEKLLASAATGERQLAFVGGGAGLGKTALIETFLDRVRRTSPSVRIVSGASIELRGAREPYMPVLEALERLAREHEASLIRSHLQRVAPTWLAQIPWLIGDNGAALRQSLQVVRPERMLREFAAFVETFTADAPLILVLEDLHWSDPSTVDLVAVLAERREPAKLLILATYRPAEASVWEHPLLHAVRSLQSRGRCVSIPVHDLTASDLREYLQARFSNADLSARLAPVLYGYTEGNPLFMVSVVDHFVARGLILETDPGWALSIDPAQIRLEVPDGALQMIEMQFGGLSPAERGVLEAASVAGHEFSSLALAAALGCEVRDAETRIDALTRSHRFFRPVGELERSGGGISRRYSFTHELYRQAAYEAIPAAAKQLLHQRIGEALESAPTGRAEEIGAELAVHFERAGDQARTLRYLTAAAARARQRFAAREAIEYLSSAIATANRLNDEHERGVAELQLRIALAPLLAEAHGFSSDRARENLEKAQSLCRTVGNEEQIFQIVYALAHVHGARADPAAAGIIEELDRLARSREQRLFVLSLRARYGVQRGDFAEACRSVEQLAAELGGDPAGAVPPFFGADPVMIAGAHHALVLWMLGRTERADELMNEWIVVAERDGAPFTRAGVLWYAMLLHTLSRNYPGAAGLAARIAGLSDEHGYVIWKAGAVALRGWVRVQQGRVREGIAELADGLARYRATDACVFSTYLLAFLAEAHRIGGNAAAGLVAIDEALAIAEATTDRSYVPELWRLKGELLLASAPAARRKQRRPARELAVENEARWREAEGCFLRALETSRLSGAKSLELRAATSLARALHTRQQSGEAQAVLASICSWFGALPHSVDLAEARAVLGDISSAA